MPLAFYYTDSLCIYVSPKFQYSLLGLEILFIYISFNFWKPLVLQAAIRQYRQADATEPYSMYSAAGVQGLTSLVMAARAEVKQQVSAVGSMRHAGHISGHISNN